MKRIIAFVCVVTLFIMLTACAHDNGDARVVEAYETELATYYEMSDGTWRSDGISYKNRLEISGKMPNADANTTFVYLTNLDSIDFDRAWQAAGFSSSTEAYFAKEDALLVDWR